MSLECGPTLGVIRGSAKGLAHLSFQRQVGQARLGFIPTEVKQITVIKGLICLKGAIDRLTSWADVNGRGLRRGNIRARFG